jgi:Zinc-binding dehydrogenase
LNLRRLGVPSLCPGLDGHAQEHQATRLGRHDLGVGADRIEVDCVIFEQGRSCDIDKGEDHPVVRRQKDPVPDPSEAHEAGGRAYPVDGRGGHVPTGVDRRYPLEEIVQAYRYVETGQKIGNVVIDIGE